MKKLILIISLLIVGCSNEDQHIKLVCSEENIELFIDIFINEGYATIFSAEQNETIRSTTFNVEDDFFKMTFISKTLKRTGEDQMYDVAFSLDRYTLKGEYFQTITFKKLEREPEKEIGNISCSKLEKQI